MASVANERTRLVASTSVVARRRSIRPFVQFVVEEDETPRRVHCPAPGSEYSRETPHVQSERGVRQTSAKGEESICGASTIHYIYFFLNTSINRRFPHLRTKNDCRASKRCDWPSRTLDSCPRSWPPVIRTTATRRRGTPRSTHRSRIMCIRERLGRNFRVTLRSTIRRENVSSCLNYFFCSCYIMIHISICFSINTYAINKNPLSYTTKIKSIISLSHRIIVVLY